jgi:LAO/AO transport system kinase
MVDFFLVILIAGAGDELQGIKRGLLEMADLVAINKADGTNKAAAERACALYRNALRLIHPPDSTWTPPVLTCSALENTGIEAIWSQVLKHRARFECSGLFEQRRRHQMVHWMRDLVNEHVERILHDKPEVRAAFARSEAAVRSGAMTAADGAESIVRAMGLA